MKTRELSITFSASGVGYSGTVPVPVNCPICHNAGHLARVYGPEVKIEQGILRRLEVVFKCPHPDCERIFIGVYEGALRAPYQASSSGWPHFSFVPTVHISRVFHENVRALSPQFIAIFDQAEAAEHAGLDQICGPGYRKSLEFLLKDFLKAKHADNTGEIESLQLGPLIKKYVDDPLLKIVSERAAWLGNDETHYIRKWEGKEIKNLKQLIDLTVHWIIADILTREYPNSMPASGSIRSNAPLT